MGLDRQGYKALLEQTSAADAENKARLEELRKQKVREDAKRLFEEREARRKADEARRKWVEREREALKKQEDMRARKERGEMEELPSSEERRVERARTGGLQRISSSVKHSRATQTNYFSRESIPKKPKDPPLVRLSRPAGNAPRPAPPQGKDPVSQKADSPAPMHAGKSKIVEKRSEHGRKVDREPSKASLERRLPKKQDPVLVQKKAVKETIDEKRGKENAVANGRHEQKKKVDDGRRRKERPHERRRVDDDEDDDDDDEEDDEEEVDEADPEDISQQIWALFGKDKRKYAARDIDSDEDDGMEARAGEIEREEARAARIARKEDLEQEQMLAEMAARKAAKRRRV
ncbi:hypothetical protein PYCC9005_000633 [Savitreella phatthalungensis]